MKFNTKVWKRTKKSFATTIPQTLLFRIDLSRKHFVEWEYISKSGKWAVNFVEKKKKEKLRFYTLLWKRSQRSYATTIPYPVLVHIDEDKDHDIEWRFDVKMNKWFVEIKEI